MEKRDSGVRMFLREFKTTGLVNLSAVFLTSPLERYSIISQTRGLLKSPTGYPSFLTYIQQVPAREGISGFFRGSLALTYHYFFSTALSFRTYYYIDSLISKKDSQNSLENKIRSLLSTFATFSVAELFVYSFDRTRTMMACDFSHKADPRLYTGTFEVFSSSLRNGGILRAYSGFGLYLSNFYIYASLVMSLLEGFQGTEYQGDKTVEALCYIFAKLAVYPLEVARKRKQVSGNENFLEEAPRLHKALSNIYKAEGIRGIYRGFLPSTVNTAVSLSLIWYFTRGS